MGWHSSRHHRADGKSEAYGYSHLFDYAVELPRGAHALTPPNDDRLRIMAVTVSGEGEAVTPAHPLYDTLGGETP